jgi:hypothetical protein
MFDYLSWYRTVYNYWWFSRVWIKILLTHLLSSLHSRSNPLLSLKYRFKTQIITYKVRSGYLPSFGIALQTSSTDRLSATDLMFLRSYMQWCSLVIYLSSLNLKAHSLQSYLLGNFANLRKPWRPFCIISCILRNSILATKRRSFSAVKAFLNRLLPSITVAKCDLYALSSQKNSAYSSCKWQCLIYSRHFIEQKERINLIPKHLIPFTSHQKFIIQGVPKNPKLLK